MFDTFAEVSHDEQHSRATRVPCRYEPPAASELVGHWRNFCRGRRSVYFGKMAQVIVGTPVQQALLISAALGPFLEATTGFGIGIVIAAPLYLAMGFPPQKAAILSLLTQSAVPWGALAVGTALNAELTYVPLKSLGVGSALVSIPLFLVYTVTVVGVAGGWRAVRQNTIPILLAWASLSASTWAANVYLSTQLAGVLTGLVTAVLLLYFRVTSPLQAKPRVDQLPGSVAGRPDLSILKAVLPYVVLIVFILAANVWPEF
jgi:lactate permease